MLQAKLVVVGGDAQQSEVRLKLPAVIGRGRDVTLTLPHPLVSRKHCEIFEKQGYLFVRDLHSLNGTYVNSTKIENEQILEPNQLLTLGNVTFRAVYQPSHAAAPVSADANDETFRVTSRPTTPDRQPDVDISDLDTQRAGIQQMDTLREQKSLKTVRQDSGTDQAVGKPSGFQGKSAKAPAGGSDLESTSNILIEDEENITPAKSISLSALKSLPPDSTQSSFAGGIEVENERPPVQDVPQSLRIDIGQEHPENKEFSESRLGSFIRKMPK